MKKIPFHPLLLGMYPALALLANNVSQVLFSSTERVFYASILITLLIFGLSRLVTKDWRKAGLVASFIIIFFFAYGQIYSLLKGISIGPIVLGRTLILLPLFLILLAAGIWWVLFRLADPEKPTEILNWISLILIAVPAFNVASYYAQAEMVRNSQPVNIPANLAQKFNGQPPTIYYIVLDMHARSDVLQKIYSYDDTWFINALKEKGFYVAEQSTSNYSSTLQSISSSMNMEYINDLEKTYGAGSNNREPLGQLLTGNKVMQLMKAMGYKIGAFATDDYYTEFHKADQYIKPSPEQIRRYQNYWSLNSFEGLFLQSTAMRVPYDLGFASSDTALQKTLETPYQLHRLVILNTADHLPDFARKKEPYFVFAHLVSPHPPYIFGPNGEEIKHNRPFSLSGPARQNGGREYMKLYTDQLNYTDRIVLKAVDEILAKSKVPPIIIIQGDHGPVSAFGEDEVEKSNMKEQHAILNAYYFPGRKYDLLYPSVSPVNSFRIVMNTFFDGKFKLLPDKSYFLPHARPYDFVDVTDRVQSDPLRP